MNFHEYQAKELFAEYGIPVPAGRVAATPVEAVAAARELGGDTWVIKAQVHAGGRGKAGGVKLAKSLEEVRREAERMLHMKISTYQTGGRELPVRRGRIARSGLLNRRRLFVPLRAAAMPPPPRGGYRGGLPRPPRSN